MPLGIEFHPEQDEQWITETIQQIKNHYRPLHSLKPHWIIDKAVEKDTLRKKWRYRGLQEIEFHLAPTYTTKDGLLRLLWHELTHTYDELNPRFQFNYEYFKQHYESGGIYERYYTYVHAIWDVWIDGRLKRENHPVPNITITQLRFEEVFPLTKESGEWFSRLYNSKQERTFKELEDIARKLRKLTRELERSKLA
ncbi:MAG: hypothetical protein N3A72_08490 [bacterium]|nr:hypothetical protein [bacterium]